MHDDRRYSAAELIAELDEILAEFAAAERNFEPEFSQVHENFRKSAANLIHYLTLRSRDIRKLQENLAALGLSSIGRAEAHTMATIESVRAILARLADKPATNPSAAVAHGEGHRLLQQHTHDLFGPRPPGRFVRIMVTMDAAAADDYAMVRDMIARGMDCMRINCAHDCPDVWTRMIEHRDRACAELRRPCRVEMDLSGPKLRTGPIEPGPRVLKWRPRRNEIGEVTAPAQILLIAEGELAVRGATADAIVAVTSEWLASLESGDQIHFRDARDKARTLKVVGGDGRTRAAECDKTAYLVPGLRLVRETARGTLAGESKVGALPPADSPIVLRAGDTIVIGAQAVAGRNATRDSAGNVLSPAMISCTLPDVFAQVRAGERIWFDDGKIGGVIREVAPEHLTVEITSARAGGSNLRADKGINLPDSEIRLPALTTKDLADLEFVARHADLVGMSFVRHECDIDELRRHLTRLGGERLGIVLKIETRQGFDHLPNLLLAVMRHHAAGAMIARGDLAVECGYARMAEVQEEMLWLCEAAHMPVVWATQVLDNLARKGQPSRAEITDAAMAERAECVLLNKGPHIVAAIAALDDILRRMEAHQAKKTSRLRALHLHAMRNH